MFPKPQVQQVRRILSFISSVVSFPFLAPPFQSLPPTIVMSVISRASSVLQAFYVVQTRLELQTSAESAGVSTLVCSHPRDKYVSASNPIFLFSARQVPLVWIIFPCFVAASCDLSRRFSVQQQHFKCRKYFQAM